MPDFFVGLDVSRRFHVAYTASQKKILTFDHSRAGFELLIYWVNTAGKGRKPLFGLEPTGVYTSILASYLIEQGFSVVMVPGVFTKRAKYFLTATGNKNDATDAKVIHDLVSEGKYKPYKQHIAAIHELKSLTCNYLRINKIWVDTLNRVHSLVDQIFPELPRLLLMKTRTPRELLKHYGSPQRMAADTWKSFQEVVYHASYGQLNTERIRSVYEAAKATVGVYREGTERELKMEVAMLDQLETYRKEIEGEMSRQLQTIPYAINLMTIHGIGPVVCAVLLSELGDLTQYDHYRQIFAASGLALRENSSGSFQSRVYISHMGSPVLRRYLFQATVVACSKKNSPFLPWYKHKTVTEGKPNKVVLVAGMRKILRICHAIARHNVPFDVSRFQPVSLWTQESNAEKAEASEILSAGL